MMNSRTPARSGVDPLPSPATARPGFVSLHPAVVGVLFLALSACATSRPATVVVDDLPMYGTTRHLLKSCAGENVGACRESVVLLLDREVSLGSVCFPDGDDRPGLDSVVAVAVEALKAGDVDGNVEAADLIVASFAKRWPGPCASRPGRAPVSPRTLGFSVSNRIEPNPYTSGGNSPPTHF